jgi:uncharacterized membrane protein
MEDLLAVATRYASLAIDSMALVLIVIGTIEAFIGGIRTWLDPAATNHEHREVWLRYSHWLVAALTFQLASDIIETAVAPTWDDIGKLAVIAIIRTFLNYFLGRDVTDVRERDRAPRKAKEA